MHAGQGACGVHAGCMRGACGVHAVCTRCARGVHVLLCMHDASVRACGVHAACMRRACGVHVACVRACVRACGVHALRARDAHISLRLYGVLLVCSGGPVTKGSIFVIDFDMNSRGAAIQWLSQYPHEEELLFPPCTGLACTDVCERGAKRCLAVSAQVSTARLDTRELADRMDGCGTALRLTATWNQTTGEITDKYNDFGFKLMGRRVFNTHLRW